MGIIKSLSKKIVFIYNLVFVSTVFVSLAGTPSTDGFYATLGTASTVMFMIGIVLGIAIIVKAGYGFMTSEGDPAKVKSAKEDITASIAGVIFILMGATLLRVIIDVMFGHTI